MLSLYFPAALWGWASDPILQIRNLRLGKVSLLANFTQLLCWDLAFGVLTLNSKLHCPWSVAGETGWTHMLPHAKWIMERVVKKGLWEHRGGRREFSLGELEGQRENISVLHWLIVRMQWDRWKMLSTVHTLSGCAASVLLSWRS